MADQLQTIVQRMIDAGETEDNIATVIQHFKATPPTPLPTKPVSAEDFTEPSYLSQVAHRFTDSVKRAVSNPATGATLGALAAAPFTEGMSLIPALATAFGAGTAGAAPAALAKGQPLDAVKEGAAAATGEGVGRAAAVPVKAIGKLVYKTALRPSLPLQRDFGDIAATGIREGIPVDAKGAMDAAARRTASGAQAAGMLKAAAPTAAPIDVAKELGPSVQPVLDRASVRVLGGLPDEAGAVSSRIASMQKANPNGIGLEDAQRVKGELQDLATRVYRAQDLGAPVLDLGADTNAALASGLRGAIENRVPGIGPVNARTQELIGLTKALEDANRRNVPGVASARALLGDFAPSVASRAGIGMSRAGAAAPSFFSALLAALEGR